MESVRLYFAQNIEKPLALDQVCDANGCSRVALQQAFRARTRMGPMEYFSCMKAEQAALLLTQGYGPGETARMLGYGSPSVVQQAVPRPDRPNARRLPPRPAPAASVRTVKATTKLHIKHGNIYFHIVIKTLE